MDDDLLRLECLKLADGDPGRAADLFDFIKRRGKYSISGTLAEAPPATEPKARVVGRDGKLEKPFDDYLRDE